MKRIIAFVLSIALAASLSACSGGSVDEKETSAPTVLAETTQPPVSDTPPTEAQPSETTPSEVSTEESQETDAPAEVDPSSQTVDLSSAATETSAEAPANVGQWIEVTRYNAISQVNEVIYWRVVNTTFDCQAEIDRYAAEGGWYTFDPLENEDMAYCMLNYEIYYPKEYPAEDYGISKPFHSLRAKSPDGGGIEWKGMAYIGLGQCYDISAEQETMPGDVFKGQCIFVMINAPEVEYIFEYNYSEAGAGSGEGEYLHAYSKAK